MAAGEHTPFEVGTRDRVVGAFVIGATLLFLVGFLIPLINRLNAEEGLPYFTVLDQTYGIGVDATVSMRGVPIGKVTDIGMTTEGLVRVDFRLSPDYSDFYRQGSRLTVDTELAVSTILAGSGLIFEPADRRNAPLEPDTLVPADTPVGISSMLEAMDIAALADQVTAIVANVEAITAGLDANQDKVYRSLDNLETVTTSLAEVSRTLPGMVASVETSLVSLQHTMAGVDALIASSDEDIRATLANSVELTEQASLTLAEAEVLLRTSAPAFEQLPITLISVDAALQSMTLLTDQLSRSWLLGGGGAAVAPAIGGPAKHAFDDAIYEMHETTTSPGGQR